ncbi:hypothetical protein [Nesterenkonia sp. K-15-9-6]|uniref:hypothetical protein n=1 Tax=Nesterenkonia sp. K-15-9-6 TaxID=3093918 RepID=UPI004044450A
MGAKTIDSDVEVTYDPDIKEKQAGAEPTPENALTPEAVAEIEAAEQEREVVPGE